MRKQADAPKRNRTEQIKFWATPEEKDLILKKMELYGTSNMGAYLRKMAIDGYVIKLELPELKEMIRLWASPTTTSTRLPAPSIPQAGFTRRTFRRFATESTACTTMHERFWIPSQR